MVVEIRGSSGVDDGDIDEICFLFDVKADIQAALLIAERVCPRKGFDHRLKGGCEICEI